MIFHHTTPWKNTIAFCILFDLHNLNLNKSHNGLLHFAEHLMFIETKTFNQDKLRIKYELLFDKIDAYTSLDFLDITKVCSRSDFAEVCQILKEMLYSWKCNKKQFLEVQQDIVEEIKNSLIEPLNKATKALGKKEYDSNIYIIGSVQRINSLTFSQLNEIKKVWKKMIDTAPRSLLIAGPKLTMAEKKIFDDLFDIKNNSKLIKPRSPIPMITRYISLPTVTAIVIDTVNSSPFFLFLNRMYYIRHIYLNPNWEFSFTRDTNHLFYIAYNNNKKKWDKKQTKEFLFNKPTKKEFNIAQDDIAKQIDSLNDGTNPEEIIGWLDIFNRNIPTLQGKTFSQIRKIYSTFSYDDFLIQWKKIFKDIEA
ncbi:insulinase family protein [Patescibacteria group bacterium]|nr:insulinase family protein [Patescibacteria group bacterium]